MVSFTRNHGATARSEVWEEQEDARSQRTGNWLPLEALDDGELFTGTPQLRAMPATRRQAVAPTRQPERTRSTQPTPLPAKSVRPGRAAKTQPSVKGVPARTLAMLAGLALCALTLYVVVSAAIEWTQVKLDDIQYGRPRTYQLDAYVGHGEADGVPSHFIAMNLNRRVTVLELPGGDSSKATALIGPYLFGQGEDLAPVQLGVQDLNGDGKPDLVVSVKSEQLLYLNDGSTFRLATADERAAIEKALLARSPAPAAGTSK